MKQMNESVTCFALLLFCLCCGSAYGYFKDLDKIEDYYWRDYTGSVPKDALPAGRKSNGEPTYIAQVLYKTFLIPGELRDGKAYYEWGFQDLNATENVMILCTKHPKKFQWAITTKDDFKTLVDKDFVPGGYEPNNRIYIGRKAFGSRTIVGKVQVILPSLEAVFHYPWDGKGLFEFGTYEVLTYL